MGTKHSFLKVASNFQEKKDLAILKPETFLTKTRTDFLSFHRYILSLYIDYDLYQYINIHTEAPNTPAFT